MLGDSNGHVLEGLLGLDGPEIQRLEDGGIIGSRPIGGSPIGAVPLETQAELGWSVGYDSNRKL